MTFRARLAVLLACCIALPACQRDHDADLAQLGPPSHRLIGHWKNHAGDESYFGPLNATSGKGDFFMVHPDGQTFHQHYALLNEEVDTQTAVVDLLFADGESRSESDVISADGSTLTTGTLLGNDYITGDFRRVDYGTVPPKSYYMAGVSATSNQPPSDKHLTPTWNPPEKAIVSQAIERQQRLMLDGAVARNHARASTASYVFWLDAMALAILLVVSLMFYDNLGWLAILTHWALAIVGGVVCIFVFHAVVTAGILENAIALAMLGRALFPRSSLS